MEGLHPVGCLQGPTLFDNRYRTIYMPNPTETARHIKAFDYLQYIDSCREIGWDAKSEEAGSAGTLFSTKTTFSISSIMLL